MMFKPRFTAALLILLVSCLSAGFSYSDPEYDPVVYKGRFFVLLEPAGPFEPDEYDEDAAVAQLLNEAQYVFSAMIYGFNFDYIPLDLARGVSEEFSLEQVYTIPWGDPGLSAVDGRYKDGRYDAEIRYRVSELQLPWVVSWDTNILVTVGASGEGSLYSGYEGKKNAIDNSVKESLRNYLRPRIYNKPRRITGTARLAEVPYITMDSGKYICKSKVTLRFDEILEYKSTENDCTRNQTCYKLDQETAWQNIWKLA